MPLRGGERGHVGNAAQFAFDLVALFAIEEGVSIFAGVEFHHGRAKAAARRRAGALQASMNMETRMPAAPSSVTMG
jgi:hypothetical protein